MAILQDIERRIEELSPSGFQQLGEAYLLSKDRNKFAVFLRIGTKLGKDKTVKGTPDTLVYTYDKEYLFIEYSTNSTDKEKKLIEDIDKNIKKHKVNLLLLSEIIIFVNYKLEEPEFQKIIEYASSKEVKCTIIGEGFLAQEINTFYPHLANLYLGLPTDTGQIIPLDNFIKEYQKKSAGLATPLDNPFLYREEELGRVINSLENNDIVILKGNPGVGKTKLALEAIFAFQNRHVSYYSFAVSYKDADLLSDLIQNIHTVYDCIVFVDDANTIERFKQIKGFYESNRIGKIKILITVRTHALNQIRDWCKPQEPVELLIETLDNDEIEKIVSESYSINNTLYLKSISQKAKGNPRIAMMIGKLAKEGHSLKSIENITQVFDLYFSTIYDDNRLTKDILKVAGIIAFSRFIDYNNSETLQNYLSAFKIDLPTFNKAKDILNDLEIVDIPIDGYLKIGEQNLCTYIIYRVFIKDKLLDMVTLFSFMSFNNIRTYRDKIYSVDVVCGRQIVSSIVRPALFEFLKSHDTEGITITVYKNFYVYLHGEIQEFVYNHSQTNSYSSVTDYNLKFDNYQFLFETNRDSYLELIALTWKYSDNFDRSFGVAFDYIKRCPHLASQLAYHIKQTFSVTREDISIRGYWQKKVIRYISSNIEKDVLCNHVLWQVSSLFLKSFLREEIWEKEFRKDIWELLQKHYSDEFSDFMERYITPSFVINNNTALFDKKYILSCFSTYLNESDIKHCIIVQKYMKWAKDNQVYDEQCDSIKSKFHSEEYSFYSKLKWDSLEDNDYPDNLGYDDYCQKKSIELRNSFLFCNENEVDSFVDKLLTLYAKNIMDTDLLCNSLSVIVDFNIQNNERIGLKLLRFLLNNNISGRYAYLIFQSNLDTEEKCSQIWDIISTYSYDNKTLWILLFLYNVPSIYISKDHFFYLIDCLKHSNENVNIYLKGLLQHNILNDTILLNILNIVYEMNANGRHIEYTGLGMKEVMDRISDNNYLFKIYIQQCVITHFKYDYQKHILKILVTIEPKLFGEFLLESKPYWKESGSIIFYGMDFVWDMEQSYKMVSMILNMVLSSNMHLSDDFHEFTYALFINKNEEKKKAIQEFLLQYFHDNINKYDLINLLVIIVRHYFPNLLSQIIKDFISSNQENDFFNIDWTNTNRSRVTVGNISYHDIIANEWIKILDIVNPIEDICAVGICNKIKSIIDDAQKRADKDRAQMTLYN